MTNLYIGVLSGTSMDAVDVAVFDFSNPIPATIATHSAIMPQEFKQKCMQIVSSKPTSIDQFGHLDHWAGEIFANAVLELLKIHKLDPSNILAIGSHGQTVWHAPLADKPCTIQIGDPNIIAYKTGITTVADFRRADMAAGGQGAPLAPGFHQAVFSAQNKARCILNIGGISNISILQGDKVYGFDTGPGNCLMDSWVKLHYNLDYDKDAEIAETGNVSEELLKVCLEDKYFARSTPKSTGREYFNLPWLQDKIQQTNSKQLPTQNVLATLLELSARANVEAINKFAVPIQEIYLCGGGAYNPKLFSRIQELSNIAVRTTAVLGIDPDWVEAGLFAWLAQQRVMLHEINTCSFTGAKSPVILGGLYAASTVTYK